MYNSTWFMSTVKESLKTHINHSAVGYVLMQIPPKKWTPLHLTQIIANQYFWYK